MPVAEEFYANRRTDINDIDVRLRLAIDAISEAKPGRVLDVACGHGTLLAGVRRQVPSADLVGCDIADEGVAAVRHLGFESHLANVEERLPFEDESFDCVFFGEVIEHLIDPDRALLEVSRVLKHNGTLVLTTPNLASWFNRLLLLAGIQPIFTETSLRVVLGRKYWALGQWKPTVGHLKLFTLPALRDILRANGFTIFKTSGAPFHEKTPIRALDNVLAKVPALASNIVIVARNDRTLRSDYPHRDFHDTAPS